MSDPELLRLQQEERTTLERYTRLQRNFYVGEVLDAAGSLWSEAAAALSKYQGAHPVFARSGRREDK